ncbi:3-galactosyl-N-acetylglucosaminide 4-alpha-L-fucosyltransferase FUT3-like [Pelodytes ibericus]
MQLISKLSKLNNVFLFFLLQAAISFAVFSIFHGTSRSGKENNQLHGLNVSEKPLFIILLWTRPFQYQFQLNNCPTPFYSSDCFFTLDRKLYPSANAVVIHHRNINTKEQLPQIPRPPNQYWVWFNTESPSHVSHLELMDNLINVTMSYRVDSDIFAPYGWLEKSDGSENFTIPEKTKLVAWAITNWNGRSRRVKYYADLKNYLKVDIFGRTSTPIARSEKLEVLSKYKFYLAFENSIHEDYITEKLWTNSFLSGTVPVVMGPPRKNYERFIPPDSFIHVDDFPTAQGLASYLLELDKDNEKYQQYFKWRSKYRPTKMRRSWVVEYCRVCKALKEAPVYRTIPSIANWFKN